MIGRIPPNRNPEKTFRYTGTEFKEILFRLPLGDLSVSALKVVADPSFGGSAVNGL
jgi:hypothetical protein